MKESSEEIHTLVVAVDRRQLFVLAFIPDAENLDPLLKLIPDDFIDKAGRDFMPPRDLFQ